MQDGEECPFDMKNSKIKKNIETYDDLLYNPCEDEQNADWITKVQKSMKSYDKELIQISCSKCFSPLSYFGR